MSKTLSAEDVSVQYGKSVAVRSASIAVPAGTVTALAGPNGAGKSSLVLAIYGSVPASGRVILGDADIGNDSALARGRKGLALVPQGRQLFPRLQVVENLSIMARSLRLASEAVDGAMERFPILADRARSLAGVLSGGEQQMLVVARALMSDPDILLLDEVATGLAPIIVEELVETIGQLVNEGTGVLLAAPEVGAFSALIEHGYVIMRGEIVAESATGAADLQQQYRAALGVIE